MTSREMKMYNLPDYKQVLRTIDLCPIQDHCFQMAWSIPLNFAKILLIGYLSDTLLGWLSKYNINEAPFLFLFYFFFQAEVTILKLTEERSSSIQERKKLQEQLAQLNQRGVSVKRVQVGFPLLYVCMVALISVALGYCLHP
ncbi:hypothetical protein PRUPE_6G335500 [Prunus persica]|uniref:Uncharacterized protein n=1 Tax=Prunus persica TaxID=3760 RepID=A0A251P105_PRUPE|nr:hypothetical protein PRUPE_6G335500 [Prunus persica]